MFTSNINYVIIAAVVYNVKKILRTPPTNGMLTNQLTATQNGISFNFL